DLHWYGVDVGDLEAVEELRAARNAAEIVDEGIVLGVRVLEHLLGPGLGRARRWRQGDEDEQGDGCLPHVHASPENPFRGRGCHRDSSVAGEIVKPGFPLLPGCRGALITTRKTRQLGGFAVAAELTGLVKTALVGELEKLRDEVRDLAAPLNDQ